MLNFYKKKKKKIQLGLLVGWKGVEVGERGGRALFSSEKHV